MARRGLIVLAALVALLGACGGGSSSNGEAGKTPKQILADARRAARDAGSFRVKGTIDDAGQAIRLDLHVGRDGGTGSMTVQGSKIDVIRIGDTVYLRTGSAFYEKVGAGKSVGQLLAGKWLKAPATSASFRDLARLTDVDRFMTLALDPGGTVTKGDETTVDGQKTIELKSSKGGSLFVATTGKPYPVQLHGGDTTTGKVVFSDWGAKVDAKAPKGAVDLSALGG